MLKELLRCALILKMMEQQVFRLHFVYCRFNCWETGVKVVAAAIRIAATDQEATAHLQVQTFRLGVKFQNPLMIYLSNMI